MALFISFDFSCWVRRTSKVDRQSLSHFYESCTLSKAVTILESVTNLHRMISLLLLITLCFGVKFCAIDRSKHKPCVFVESIV